MNFSTNWRDRRTIFTTTHYSIANFNTETKNDMKTTFGEDMFLNNLHLIPDPLMKNLADTIITENKMAPKSKLEKNIDVKSNENMHIQADYSPLSGITSFFAGVVNVISNAMFSKRKQADFVADSSGQMAPPSMWQNAKLSDENKILHNENNSNDMAGDILVSEMTDVKKAVAHCQNKIEQVRLLLGSKPVPCIVRTRRRPKRVFVEPGSVEDSFEDAFTPEDFENIANDSYIQYSSPVCYQNQVLQEIDSPRVKIETDKALEMVPEPTPVCETTDIVKNVPENETANVDKLNCDKKEELVASCEDKISKLKALLQERKKKPVIIEPEPASVQETKEFSKRPKSPTKTKDKRFKNPNRNCSKRTKARMRKNIQDDVLFANEINSDDLSSVENSPQMSYLEKNIPLPKKCDKEYFDEVSGRFHSSSTTDSEDSFQIVFTDSPKLRRASDCESEDSFIVFEDSPDSCYTSNDVFGDSGDSEEYDSDSDLSDSGCGTMSFNLAPALSKSVCNLTDDSLYVDRTEDEVDCANLDRTVSESASLDEVEIEDTKTSSLLDDKKKLLRKNLPAKRVQFSEQRPKVHVMRVWAFAARQARIGNWQQYRADKERFDRRIADVDMAVSWVLKPQHRSRVMFQRFMPWWNAQRRKEIAEKKEKDAQEKLRLEEEALRIEEEALRIKEALRIEEEEQTVEVNVVGDTSIDNENKLDLEERKAEDDDSKSNTEGNKDETKQSGQEGIKKELNTNNKVNGELKTKELNKNNKKFDSKTKFKKEICEKNNDGDHLNDKILSLQKDFAAQKILDT